MGGTAQGDWSARAAQLLQILEAHPLQLNIPLETGWAPHWSQLPSGMQSCKAVPQRGQGRLPARRAGGSSSGPAARHDWSLPSDNSTV